MVNGLIIKPRSLKGASVKFLKFTMEKMLTCDD